MSRLFDQGGPLSTGIEEVDLEHAALHLQAKKVGILLASRDFPAVRAALGAFVEGCATHFAHEERFFDQLRVGGARVEAHRAEHRSLVAALQAFAHDLDESDDRSTWTHFVDLEDTLLLHVVSYDLDFQRSEP